jgi:hypothetical protein
MPAIRFSESYSRIITISDPSRNGDVKGRETALYTSAKPRYTKVMKNKLTPPSDSLLEKLTRADICCRDCGMKFGVYSVGCSSTWIDECPICGETKGCTETRDYGYLTKGINELKAWRPVQPFSELTKDFPPERRERIREQSKILAEHLATLDPIMNDDELEATLEEDKPSYERGEITLKLTEEEVAALQDMLEFVEDHEEYELDDPCKAAINKVFDLYDDYCVKYTLAPAMKAYISRYGAIPGPDDDAKWEIFRDTYNWMIGEGAEK